MTTLQAVELGVLGPLQVRQGGAPVAIPGAKPRAILTMLGLHHGSVVAADTLVELLWGEDPPRTAAKALQTHISALRRALGDGFVLTQGTGWAIAESDVDASRYTSAARLGRDAVATGDTSQAVARFEEALTLWRGIPELPDGRRGASEKTRWVEGHAALVEDRADALLATARAAEIVGELEAAVAEAPLRERRWGQLMLALYRAGRQGDALGAYQRARTMLADELGIDPGPELRRLETAIVAQDASLDVVVAQQHPSVMRAVTFLLTDIEGSTAAWEADAEAMAVALARHDELAEQVVTSRGGRLIKTRGEGDATFSVFERPSAAAAAAMELQDAITHEPWGLREPMRIRIALHTGEVELRDGDYFGRAVNRAARLRSLAVGGQILCSGATAELVVDSLPDDVVLADLGLRELRNLARPEHVFELRLETAEEVAQSPTSDAPPMERPGLPSVLIGTGPFVGRGNELERLLSAWQTSLGGGARAALIAGEPGVGKTRLAGEWSRQAYDQGAVVLYGRCDEDLGAPYQPFAEALRSLVPCVGSSRLRGLRGVEALLPLVPGLVDDVPDLAAPTRADPDTERYALFDAVVALLEMASGEAPVVLILDDLHWAAKPTLLLLRHLLRFGDRARVQVVGTYRSTDLDRSHPLAAMLADLHRDGTANRISLSGLDEDDVSAYVAKAGYDDEELGHALASVTGGNPFFLIEALRHVDESGGVWDSSTLPQGVREAVSRRLSRLPIETNKALAAAAVVGSRFALDLVERVVGDDLVDAFDEASKAGIVIEEPGGRYRFNHALVRQSLLAELPSMRRMRLHQRIATTLEDEAGADDELLAELAHHYFECAWAGNAAKAVEYCRRAADQAMTRLAYEGAAELYDHALHALDEIDDELPDRDDQVTDLLVARCEALLAAGDVASAAGAVSQLQQATVDSARLSAWATCFDGQLSVSVHPERLDEVEAALAAAARKLAEIDDAAGEAKAHTVRATCLARLGRIGDCEIALDDALTAARRARDHRRVNAVLAGAPLAALWGPNPVPRAGGRCLDVVRLLRITTDSPAVEATSTRCQAVLEAFRGRDAAARRMIDSARRTVTELGLRHALLEVEQFAGIVELVLGDPANAEPHLRQACNGFRRMGLDADTAETAALLGRACLALNRDAEADELCTESERLAGHALKASIAWRTLRAQLLSRSDDHDEARRVAQAAITLAERTDGLVDHGDACATLARVLGAAGDAAGARAAAERAASLYERKGAAALADKARSMLDEPSLPPVSVPPEVPPVVELDTAAVRAGERVMAAVDREAWDEFERVFAPGGSVESRRKVVGFKQNEFPSVEVMHQTRCELETGAMRVNQVVIAVRGERLALARTVVRTADTSPGAPSDEFLQLYRVDDEERISLQIWFDLEDMDAAIAELDALQARFEDERSPTRRLENAASQAVERYVAHFVTRDWDALAKVMADNIITDDRRRGANAGIRHGRDAEIVNLRTSADAGVRYMASVVIAVREERLVFVHASGRYDGSEEFLVEMFAVVEINSDNQIATITLFDLEDFDAAIAELDARYLAGEGAGYAHTWSVIAGTYASVGRGEFPAITPNCVTIDHRPGSPFAPGEVSAAIRAGWDLGNIRPYVEVVHRLSDLGAVCSYAAHGVSHQGFDAEWQGVNVVTVDGEMVNHTEFFDEADIDLAITRFEELSRPAARLENTATVVFEHVLSRLAARDWEAVAETVADSYSGIDHRSVVNAENQHGRDAVVKDVRVAAEIGFTLSMVSAMAIRGERLVLARVRVAGRDPETIQNDALNVVEIDNDDRIATVVVYDLEDFDEAVAEIDARYLAGEAAPYARTWSAIANSFVSIGRGELPPTTPDCVSVDHRRAAAFAPGELLQYLRAGFDLDQQVSPYFERVLLLNELGAVVTHAAHGTSREGFSAEWRGVNISMVDGEMISRCEIFDQADVDLAITRFEELSRPAPRLENAASRATERLRTAFAAAHWDDIAALLADNVSSDDRRRLVSVGIQHGQNAVIAELRVIADLGPTKTASTVLAIRGGHLVLNRVRFSDTDERLQRFQIDMLNVVEINDDNQIAAYVTFDVDDFDAAIAELDARYIAGEAATHARTWSVITEGYAAVRRKDFPAITPDSVTVDHRRATAFGASELSAHIHAGWDLGQDIRPYIEAVHRLSDLGAVCSYTAHGVSRQGFDAEWQGVNVVTVDGDMVSGTEYFDEADLDAAITRFDQLSQVAPRLDNASIQMGDRLMAHFAAGDWDAMAEILADNLINEDRRRVVSTGIFDGRDAQMANLRAVAELWSTNSTRTVMATRGKNLSLARASFSRGEGVEAFLTEFLAVMEIDTDERISAIIVFDVDDFDAAIAELDARYLAGEAAAHAHVWSVIAGGFGALRRSELPLTTPDCVSIDHRRTAAFALGELNAYTRAAFELTADHRIYVEAVHRLNDAGTVCTHVTHGVSHEGFAAEWREVDVLMVEGNIVNRCEIFDEADLHAALAKFEELSRPAPRLENAASRVDKRFQACFAARDWDVMAEMLSGDFSTEDRRRVVNMGKSDGRDAELTVHAYAAAGTENVKATVIATRAQRLALNHYRFSGSDQLPGAFRIEFLAVVEIDADQRMAAVVVFDVDDFAAAIAELDARYVTGEAAAHARTWLAIAEVYAALNRGEMPATAPDLVDIDHRSLAAIGSGDLMAYLHAASEDTPGSCIYIETVHRLTDLGAVTTHVTKATSQEGFDAEWRITSFFIVGGDLINRYEIFDEVDLDTALARFAELQPQALRLENAVAERFLAHFAARDWDALAHDFTENYYCDDRRRVVNAGLRQGRDAAIEDLRVSTELGLLKNVTMDIIATRGERLILTNWRGLGLDQDGFQHDALQVVEHDADGRITAAALFDVDDIDAAFEELDARYLAGEAALHARTWSVVASSFAAFNRQELLAADWVTIDHRQTTPFEPSNMTPSIRDIWDLTPNLAIHIEAVHRLNNFGAVITHEGHGTSLEGFDAEWRAVDILMVDGDSISRCEIFDEADLDAALARFDELQPQAPRLENAASQAYERFRKYFAARDWDAMAELLTEDTTVDDHRRVVNAETRRGRDVEIQNMRAFADIGVKRSTSEVVATRGERLALCRTCISDDDHEAAGFRIEMLIVVETTADNRILARVAYEPDEMDSAVEELDARYLAGEAAAYANTWSVIAANNAAFNRRELPAAEWVTVEHRRLAPIDASNLHTAIRSVWDLTPDISSRIEAVHRIGSLGAVVTDTAYGTSPEGFAAEWRMIQLLTVEGDQINRSEFFDEADLDAALARFDLVQPQAPRLENAVGRILERYRACFSAREWTAMSELLADDIVLDDRRRIVNAGVRRGRAVHIADLRAAVEVGAETISSSVVATRGERLALAHARAFNRGAPPGEVGAEWLGVAEIDSDERIVAIVVFDLDDIDAAFAELDARYLTGEAAAHSRTWSVIARVYTAFNRHEIPTTTPDSVYIDHRPLVSIETVGMAASIRAVWDLTPGIRFCIEAVHRLSELGAVVTGAMKGTSPEGLDAEWQMIDIFTVEGDRLSRFEVFDETELGAALARFEGLHAQTGRLENAASRVHTRLKACIVARDWNAATEFLADDIAIDDRRRAVNSGIQYGRDAAIADLRSAIDLGLTNISLTVIAIRGARLELCRMCVSGDDRPDAFRIEFLSVVEINADERMVARFGFDLDDADAAFEELDARYLAGEGAPYAHTWSLIAAECAAFNRHELPAAQWVTIDHRRLAVIDATEGQAAMRAIWEVTPNLRMQIEAVHRLSGFGVVASYAAFGTSPDGLDVEWPMILLLTVDGDRINTCEIFDEADLDAALARFEELHAQARRLENAASEVDQRFWACIATRDWEAIADRVADDIYIDDRRKTVNAGVRHGRDAYIADLRTIAEFSQNTTSTVVATRGIRLALTHIRASNRNVGFAADLFCVVEIDVDDRMVARIGFDIDDIDAAFAELDARYLASEAAAHAEAWSIITRWFTAVNKHEIPPTTPDWVAVDHRRLPAFEGGDLPAALRGVWDVTPDLSIHVERVHRLSSFGVVATFMMYGTSPEGFAVEWRTIEILTVEGDRIKDLEIFDEADLDAALARFDELQPHGPRLENAASQVYERFQARFANNDWDAIADMLTADLYSDDRRPVVGGGIRPGRDALIEDLRAVTDVEIANATSDAIAIRGGRLALARARYSRRHGEPDPFHVDYLQLVEIDIEDRITAFIAFDGNDIDAAFEELDARYRAGEAAPYTRTWSVMTSTCAAFNRGELPATTPDSVFVDHRPVLAVDAVDLPSYLRVMWDLTPDIRVDIVAVHRLSELGAVLTHAVNETSPEGFNAEWRGILIYTLEADMVNRCEVFDEADLDAALARFDELQPKPGRLANAAIRATERLFASFAAREWDSVKEILASDFSQDDRRRVVGAGVRHGRDDEIADLRAIADLWAGNPTGSYLATRGERLDLMRLRFSLPVHGDEPFVTEVLGVGEINAHGRVVAAISFDPDDIDAAFDELDARYLAGEAAEHAHTWSIISGAYASMNRHELFATTRDWVNVDHRRPKIIEQGGLNAPLLSMWTLIPDVTFRVEAVHRLTDLGAVCTHVAQGISQGGFDAEWRGVELLTVDGDLISRCEMFDEADLDAALTRFDELDGSAA